MPNVQDAEPIVKWGIAGFLSLGLYGLMMADERRSDRKRRKRRGK